MRSSRHQIILIAFAAAIALGACDESVQPVLQTDRPFTIYGYLNPLADTQAVRLYTIDGVLEHTSAEPADAVLTVTDLSSSEAYSLRDSVVEYKSGMFGHVFWTTFRPQFENTYRIEATRSDGASVSAVSTVPPVATPEVGVADLSIFVLPIPILIRGAPNLIDIRATYYTDAGNETIAYGVQQTPVPEGRLFYLEFRPDTRQLLLNAISNGQTSVHLDRVEVRAVVTNAEWTPPGGVFDENALVEPGTFSNVENGFGFIGAGYPLMFEFVPPDNLLRAAGFTVD